MTASAHRERNFGLDIVRALAISMVFLAHGVTLCGVLGVGVDLFFVLSGFLIGRIYFRSTADGTFSLWRFWQMRWGRTLPPYYAALAFFALASLKFPGNPIRPYYLLFVQNYIGIEGFGPSWSLCVEEHFYLLLPLLCGVVDQIFGNRAFSWFLPIAALAPAALRIAFVLSPHGLPTDWYWMSHLHCEGLVVGVLLAFLFVHHRSMWDRLRPIAIGLAWIPWMLVLLISFHPISDIRFNALIFLLYAVGFGGFVRISYDIRWRPVTVAGGLLQKCIQGLSLCSYSIYLVHVLVFNVVRQLLDGMNRGPLKSGIILASTLMCGILFYFLFEKSSIELRDRFLRRARVDSSQPVPVA